MALKQHKENTSNVHEGQTKNEQRAKLPTTN
jgi:hypothetical protein